MSELAAPLQRLLAEFVSADGPPASLLPQHVRAHVDEMREAARRDEMLPLDLAEEIAHGLLTLLEASDVSDDDAKLVCGAARYFISNQDHRPDLDGPLGLDDDAVVFNYVAAKVGRDDLKVDL